MSDPIRSLSACVPAPSLDPTSVLNAMSLEESLNKAELALIASLGAKQAGIDDRTGKGSATESIVAEELLKPHLPRSLLCSKGAVVSADDPAAQSPAIDRVIHDPSLASPLIHSDAHSVFPIEAVLGLVEITMHLNATKLREDIERMVSVKAMLKRRYLVPVPNTTTKACPQIVDSLSPRSFVVGLPADPGWSPRTIAAALRSIRKR